MGPLDYLGISADELDRRLDDGVWRRWQQAEPVLAGLPSLQELREVRGAQADEKLGALVRLAAVDGGNDDLALAAVAIQLVVPVRRLAYELQDLGSNIDGLIMSSLWVEIRTYPWRCRSRAYATSLMWATRTSVLNQLLLPSRDRARTVLIPADALHTNSFPVVEPLLEPGDAQEELLEFLDWCQATGWVDSDDVRLVADLLVAAWATRDKSVLKLRRGVCSLHAVQVVAEERGVSPKTVIRQRDRILASLRKAAPWYLRDVA